jgi:hypothetical protein
MAMDINYEDKIYRQIEKSLSNNINDKLFVPIEMIDDSTYKGRKNKQVVDSVSYEENTVQEEPVFLERNKVYNDRADSNMALEEHKEVSQGLPRAEYIRQAREACLRQMNTLDTSGRISDNYILEEESTNSHGRKKREKSARLFYEGSEEENHPEDVASFKSLTIRTVCAVVIFLSVFVIDKVKLNWGVFSYETIRQYVTGNNQLKVLEEILITWLK